MTTRSWSPSAGLVALVWVLLAAAVLWLVLTDEAAARLMAGVAAVALALLAAQGTFGRPRLAADPDGLTVRSLFGSRRYPWSSVGRVRVVRTRRFGRETPVLEIDVVRGEHEHLLVLTRLDLGGEPDDVADELVALRGAENG
ncbi:PH domain-containing protein [Streptoalloteichus tenebrarius]|uniref:PH domain-containing protein n=1 Tax=Streptoalloteichus tenebrarius (strain ATCC 17920 / DSM 40477 / JCM 4838 / CBS 697.72 / NBRC 16177 / NCIMB 11028 / NRRL B-12390 / A12253. 1 / ISP 5477) TaxID=1933 RepID=UPI0020A29C1C|nr:PH domain-containing protein [Streptoalloteichus tenebrarius]